MLWGLVAVLCLFGYSVYSVLTDDSEVSADVPTRTAVTSRPKVSFSTANLPPGTSDPPRAKAFFIMLLCDGETIQSAIYDGPIFEDHVALTPTHDRAVMADIVAGVPTVFPSYARVFPSTCFTNAVQSGAFP
jgi:hypothetical protein